MTREFASAPGRLHGAFVLVWKAQSMLATIAFLALVAFGPLVIVLPIMLTWAAVATVVYAVARSRGYPDMLETAAYDSAAPVGQRAKSVACSAAKVWVSGLNSFVYARAARNVITTRHKGWRALPRFAVLAGGLTFFGVATCEHLLRRAGFQGRQLLQLSLIGVFLNVPYRILLSAVVTQALWEIAHTVSSTAAIV